MTPRRIGLLGGECTGKSTLARALADVLPGCVADEAARDFVAVHGRSPQREEQEALFREQQERIDRTEAACRLPWIIADPLPLMTAVYSIVYFGDDSLIDAGLDDCQAYQAVVWCSPDIPWLPDPGVRDGLDFRVRADSVIADVVSAIRQRGVTLVTASGSLAQRLEQCALAWQTSTHEERT